MLDLVLIVFTQGGGRGPASHHLSAISSVKEVYTPLNEAANHLFFLY